MDFRLREQLSNHIDKIYQVVKTLKKEKEQLLNQINLLKIQNAKLQQDLADGNIAKDTFKVEKEKLLSQIKSQQDKIEAQNNQIEQMQSQMMKLNDDNSEIENKLMEIIACLPDETTENVATVDNESQLVVNEQQNAPITVETIDEQQDLADVVLQKFTTQNIEQESQNLDQLLKDFQIDPNNPDGLPVEENVVTTSRFESDSNLQHSADENVVKQSVFVNPFAEERETSVEQEHSQTEQLSEQVAPQTQVEQPTIEPEHSQQESNAVDGLFDNQEPEQQLTSSLFDDVQEATEAESTDESQPDSEIDFNALSSIFDESSTQGDNSQQSSDTQQNNFASANGQANAPFQETEVAEQQLGTEETFGDDATDEQSSLLSGISDEDYNPLLFEDDQADEEVNFELPEEDVADDENKGGSFNDGWADGVL